jgi:hypothetical protein
MALASAGHLSLNDVEGLWSAAETFTPALSGEERFVLRSEWAQMIHRVEKTIPGLSDVSF